MGDTAVFFEVLAVDRATGARRGRLVTNHGEVQTPAFMPVGTQATVKAMMPSELRAMGVEMVLGNAYHMRVRPGLEVVEACGGLHGFMGWDGPILTDSGGYQVFSLAGIRRISDDGVEFQSHVDGTPLFFGPGQVMEIQARLGSDIAMVLDECPPYPCPRDYACQAVRRTIAWAARCLEYRRPAGQRLFGIVQGGQYPELRARCADALIERGFDGYAIGGVSVGEPERMMIEAVAATAGRLPADKPRYLMGVGMPGQVIEAVALGVDMFDCVAPTRLARHGTALTRTGRFALKAGSRKAETGPIEEGCSCAACAGFSRAYVRHLLNAGEILGMRLLTIHNLHCLLQLLRDARAALENGTFGAFLSEFRSAREAVPAAEVCL